MLVAELKVRDHLEGIGTESRIILKWMLKTGMRVWLGIM
jgi:hypothetical protein